MKANRRQTGFTLIELMIVVAIIAILASIAVPAYQDYTIRAQISEGLVLAGGARAAVWEYTANFGVFPNDNAEAGIPSPTSINGKFVTSVTVAAGQIDVTFGNRANSAIQAAHVQLTPVNGTGSLNWTCLPAAGMNTRFMPTSCRF